MCPNETGTLSVLVTNNTSNSPVTYTYTLPNGSTIVSANSSIPISATGVYSVEVNVLGCSNSQSITVGQSVSNWIFTLTAPATMCPNETGTLSVNVTNNPSNLPVTYTYTLPNGTTIVSANSSIPINVTGVYSVEVNILGCSNSQSITVGQSVSNWVFILSAPATMCPNESGTLSVLVTNNPSNLPVTYTYTLPNGSTIVSANSSIPISATGVYSVEVNILGCSNSQSITVGQSVSNWIFTLTAPATMCPNETGTLSVNITNNPLNLPVTYTYTLPNGSTIVSANSSIPISVTGVYSVNVNILGCSNSQSITVGQSISNWIFTLTAPATMCPNETGTLSVTITNNPSNLPVTYTYTLPNGSTIVSANNSIPISATGVYSVNVNILGCSNSQSITVGQSVSNWNFNFLNEPYLICQNQFVQLSFNASNFAISNPNAIYTWTSPNGTQTTGTTLSANQLGDYSLEVNILGCKSTKVATVSQNTSTVAITITSGCEGSQFIAEANPVNASFDPALVTFSWTGPNFTSIPNLPNSVIVNESGTYTVRVTTPDGCFSDESVMVSGILCTIQKGISPNGDGDNESFILTDVKKLSIYNRYGGKVYTHYDYTNQWHGQTDAGSELPDGTYYYVIERGSGVTLTGWIYINR
jgi:gliding motility-associated-like protein